MIRYLYSMKNEIFIRSVIIIEGLQFFCSLYDFGTNQYRVDCSLSWGGNLRNSYKYKNWR